MCIFRLLELLFGDKELCVFLRSSVYLGYAFFVGLISIQMESLR